MPTPQITLRVHPERLQKWKQAANQADISVSEQIRELMDWWAREVLGESDDSR